MKRMTLPAALILGTALLAISPAQDMPAEETDALKVRIITLDTEAELLSILERLKAGASFSDLAHQHSTHPTSETGGYWEIPADEELAADLRQRFSKASEGAILYLKHPRLGYTVVRQESRSSEKQHRLRSLLREGSEYLRKAQFSQAIEAFKRAISLEQRFAEAHMLLGYAYRLSGNHNFSAEAKAEFRQALALDPSLLWARFYLSKMYIDLGRLSKAKEQLETTLKWHPDNLDVKALLGDVERQLGSPGLSVRLNSEILERSPSHTAGNYYLGLAYLDMNREDDALRRFRKAAELEGASAEVHVSLGSLLLDRGEVREASGSFQKAIELDSSHSPARLGLAAAYRRLGRLDKALEELKQTLPADRPVPSSPYFQQIRADIQFERGLVFQQKGRLSEAIQAFSEALALLANHGKAHRSLAEVLFEQRKYQLAEEHALKAEELKTPVAASLRQKIREKSKGGS